MTDILRPSKRPFPLLATAMSLPVFLLLAVPATAQTFRPRPDQQTASSDRVPAERPDRASAVRSDGSLVSFSAPAQSGGRRLAWTLVGGGIGFGAGLLAGLSAFDDALYAERKIGATAAAGAAGGAVLGYLISGRSQGGPARPAPKAGGSDSLRNGMIVGAAVGAGIGMWYVPRENCNTDTNPECPRILRAVVGIPAIAGGAAIGALVDRAIRPNAARGAAPTRKKPLAVFSPVIGRGAVGFQFYGAF